MREKSAVVRATPIAPISSSPDMIAAISALRMARSDGRTRPASVAAMKTGTGVSRPAKAKQVMMTASVA